MSIPKANKFLLSAAASIGLVGVASYAVAETMLDQCIVNKMDIVQVDDAGKCVAYATLLIGGNVQKRFVGDASGGAKLYTDLSAVARVIKNVNAGAGAEFVYHRKLTVANISDPISMLKTLHKAFMREKAATALVVAKREASITVANGLGWSVLPEDREERQLLTQYEQELLTLNEVLGNAVAKLAEYATLLTNAGINPATYLPIV